MAEHGTDGPRAELVSPLLVRRLAAVLDLDPGPVLDGGDLPPLWHWALFTQVVPQSRLGTDGHPQRDPQEVADFPRRMFAGARLSVEQPLRIGATASCVSTVTDVTEKEGRRGRMRFVTMRDELTDSAGGSLVEERDVVYLSGGGPGVQIGEPAEAPAAPWQDTLVPDPALLFRFSAVTFNSHRIHYDQPYATQEEGYPALVVHGPLLALRLCELGRAQAGAPITEFAFRARQPAFVGESVALRGWPDGDRAELAAYSRGANPAMTASLTAGSARRAAAPVVG